MKDASGKTLHQALPKFGRTLALSVHRSALAGVRYPVTIGLVVGPEYPASDPVYVGAPGYQEANAVASNGSDYFVVWQDNRSGDFNAPWSVYGTRVTSGGVVLDPGGIPIAPTGTFGPAVAWQGDHYLVVWQTTSLDVYGTRVSATGSVLDPNGFAIVATSAAEGSVAVASDGTNSLVTWQGNLDVRGARVNASGVVLGSPIEISSVDNPSARPDVAWNGHEYFVTWTDNGGPWAVRGARLGADGTVLDTNAIVINSGVSSGGAEVASDGSAFLVVWLENDDAYGARVSDDGVVLDQSPIVISAAPQTQVPSDVASDGTDYVVTWSDRRSGQWATYAARVTAGGSVLDPDGIAIATGAVKESQGGLAWNGSRYLIAWIDFRDSARSVEDVFAERMNPDGALLDGNGFMVSSGASSQKNAAIAWDGATYLVVWEDGRAPSGADIYGARVKPDGTILDGTGIPISTGAGEQLAPSVAWNGSNYWVVWQRSGCCGDTDVYGARVSPAGAVLDPGAVPIATSPLSELAPSISAGKSKAMVVWERYSSGSPGEYDVYAARLSPTGSVLDGDGIPIQSVRAVPAWEPQPSVASDGTDYLVAWSDYYDISGRRVSGQGAPGRPFVISHRPFAQHAPTIAWSGSTYLVAWVEEGDCFVCTSSIYATRLNGAGARLGRDRFAIAVSPSTQQAPVAAWDGANFVVAWLKASGSTAATPFEVRAARVTVAGEVLDPAGRSVAGGGSEMRAPTIAAGPHRALAIAYSRFAPATPYGGFRIFRRSLRDAAPTVRCRVPRLVGLKLASARTKIRRAHCAVGRTRRVRVMRKRMVGRVIGQSPRRGTRWPRGKRVNVLVGRR